MPASFALASISLHLAQMSNVQGLMEVAFYPALLGVLVVASLGIPIPEDIPLIAAGVLLKTHPGIANWPGTIAVALLGIMSGDLVLYSLGRIWGPGVVSHRYVRRLLSRRRYAQLSRRFHRHGPWMVFVGRFFVGIRAAMCLTAGSTRYPYWKFFLADFAGALLSVPFFVMLGYVFASMIPTLRAYVSGIQLFMLGGAIIVAGIILAIWLHRRSRGQFDRLAGTDNVSPDPSPLYRTVEDDPKSEKSDPARQEVDTPVGR